MSTKHTATCDCGWTGGPYRSEKQAAYSLRQHSCDAQRRRDENAARNRARLARLAKIDRAPRACTHPDEHGHPRHQHGTYVAYTIDHCRCTDCATASAEYERNRVRRNAYGRSNLTDATPVRDHIAELTAAGVGLKQITRHTGLDRQRLDGALHGRDVVAATHRAVATAYEQLWDVPAPRRDQREKISAARAQGRAQREGWAPPLAWDDAALDDPAATPHTDAGPARRQHGGGVVNHDSLTDCAIEWGLTITQAAHRLGVSKSTIDHGLRRFDTDGTLTACFARNLTAHTYKDVA